MRWYKEQVQLTIVVVILGMFGEVIFPPLASIEIIWPIIWVVGIIAIQIYKKGK